MAYCTAANVKTALGVTGTQDDTWLGTLADSASAWVDAHCAVPAGYVRFIRPVAEPANSAFGTRSVFNGKPGSPHTGADFLSGTGTPIKSPTAGHVRLAEDLYFSGNTVIVDHGLGLQ